MGLKIIYEDENALAVDKPAGVPVYPPEKKAAGEKKSLAEMLLEKRPEIKKVGKHPRYGIVHRLDKDTSGVVLFAKNQKTLGFLQKLFKNRKAVKKYYALVLGKMPRKKGEIKTLAGRDRKNGKKQKAYPLFGPEAKKKGVREAITEYRVLQEFENCSLLEVFPKTGRRHQIRVHFFYAGRPVAGDKLYKFKNQDYPKSLARQFLHAAYLRIKLPGAGEKEFHSPLPADLKRALEELESEKKRGIKN